MQFFPKAYADFVQRLRVPSGMLLAAAFVWLAQPVLPTLLIGFPIAVLGLALRAWAAGHLRKNEQLTTSGPYAWVRNPLYIGTLLAAIGCTVAAARPSLAALAGVVFLCVYLPVMELEEQHLRAIFPEFEAYARLVPQLLPRLPRHDPGGQFSWAMYRRNREDRALYGFLAVYAFLIYKSL